MLRIPMRKGHNMQEQICNISRKMETKKESSGNTWNPKICNRSEECF